MDTQANQFLLDGLYSERIDETGHSIEIYRKVYELKPIEHNQSISDEFFDYVRRRKFFVIASVYDSNGRFLLIRTVDSDFGWSLPGGSIRSNEDAFDAVKRIVSEIIPGLALGEIEPIALVSNNFTCKDRNHDHIGIVFLARARKLPDISIDATCKFVRVTESELKQIHRFANREALQMCVARVSAFDLGKQENEIEANEVSRARYVFHNNVMKRFLLTPKRKRKIEQMNIFRDIVANKRTIVDVSCGDSLWPQSLVALNPAIDFVFANDLSWSQVELNASAHPKIKYSNHDAIFLPFRDKVFDLAICMNTLHHMPSRNHLIRLLESMARVAKEVLIWEVMNPKRDAAFPRILNKYYYEGFLHDQGVAYLDTSQFRELISTSYPGGGVRFEQFKNILGTFNYAVVTLP